MLIWLLIFLVMAIATCFGLSKMFEKAGEAGWKAYVPGLNLAVIAKLIGMPYWKLIMLVVPILNIFILANMFIDLVNSFGKWDFLDQTLAVVAPWYFFPKLGLAPGVNKYNQEEWVKSTSPNTDEPKAAKRGGVRVGPGILNARDNEANYFGPALKLQPSQRPPKGLVREWTDSIVFAVFAAHLIRMFLIEAFTIPTPSMEGSLLVGDFLFVSKVHYGPRLPSRPLSFPLVHNTLPGSTRESYLNWPNWGYYRFPKLQEVQRYEPVVFNYPEGDSIIPGAPFGDNYYEARRLRKMSPDQIKDMFGWVARPVDKRDHYIKRCVGVPGDVVEVKNHVLYVNGQKAPEYSYIQYSRLVKSTSELDLDKLSEELDLTLPSLSSGPGQLQGGTSIDTTSKKTIYNYYIHLSNPQTEKLRKNPNVISIEVIEDNYPRPMFPYFGKHKWTNDNYGPIAMPSKGSSIVLNDSTAALYKRAIVTYEGNTLEKRNGQFLLNGQPATSYTFKMGYYWMMGDNRHQSADSRVFGYVPEDHIVGKPLFIWMSWKNANLFNGIRFGRMFTGADKR